MENKEQILNNATMKLIVGVIVWGFLAVGLIGAGGIVYLIRSSVSKSEVSNLEEHEPTPQEWARANQLLNQFRAEDPEGERLLEYYKNAPKAEQDEIDRNVHKLYREAGQE